jgi:hypothetical protein
MGLFAAIDLDPGEVIGCMLDGYLLGLFDSLDSPELEATRSSVGGGYLFIHYAHEGVVLRDGRGSRSGGPRSSNDSKDLRKGNNARLDYDGFLRVAPYAGILRLRPGMSVSERRAIEITYNYDRKSYWNPAAGSSQEHSQLAIPPSAPPSPPSSGTGPSSLEGPLGSEAELVHIDRSLEMQAFAAMPDTAPEVEAPPTGSPAEPFPGLDPDFDSLFEAAVLVNYVALVEDAEKTSSVCSATPSHGSVGEPVKLQMPSKAQVIEAQRQHPATAGVFDFLENGELSKTWELVVAYREEKEFAEKVKHYRLSDSGLLMHQPPSKSEAAGRIVVPPQFRNHILHHFHDRLGHPGVAKTAETIARRFYWPELRNSVASYIRKCEPCQRSKVPGIRAGEMQVPDTGRHPGDIIVGDHYYVGIVEDGYDSTLDFACCFSRGIRSTPIKGVPSSEQIIDVILRDIIRRSGVPSEIRSDAASAFISKAVRELYDRMGILMVVGTAYHHQLVALVERWHRTLKQLMTTLQASRDSKYNAKWYLCLPVLELAYNQTVNSSTGYSPFFLENLRHPRLPFDFTEPKPLPASLPDWVQSRLDELDVAYDAAARSLRLNSLSSKKKYDLRRDTQAYFNPGDRVLLIVGTAFDRNAIHPKSELPTSGPYTVTRAFPYDRYGLADLHTRRVQNTVHVSRLLPFRSHTAETDSSWMMLTSENGGRWPVHSVVGRRVVKLARADHAARLARGERVLQYKIRWVGFDQKLDRWLSVQYLSDILELVKQFDARHPPDPLPLTPAEEVVDRQSGIDVPPLPPPGKRPPTFRSRMHPGPKPDRSTGPGTVKKAKPSDTEVGAEDVTAVDEVAEQERDSYRSLQRIQEGMRVRAFCKRTKQMRAGVVVRSWLTRWRDDGQQAHMVRIQYDEPDKDGEVYGQCNAEEAEAEQTDDAHGDKQHLTDVYDNRSQQRVARIQRELS